MKQLTRKEALNLLKKYNIKGNILKHSLAVNKFAISLANRLIDRGKKVDMYLVDIGNLVHDIGRVESDNMKKGHAEVGYDIMIKEGYLNIVEIVRKHGLNSILKDELKTIEEEIVYYADKRVEIDKVVSLNKRVEGLIERHPEYKDSILKAKPKIIELEKELGI